MRKSLNVILLGSIQLSAYPQPYDQAVRIIKDIELIRITDEAYIHVFYQDIPDYGCISSNGLILVYI